MRCWTATAWSGAPAKGGATRRKARPCRRPPPPTRSGAPTARVSSSSATASTVTPDRHRLGLALPAAVRGPCIHQGKGRLRGLPAALPRARPARGHPLRQRPALRQPQRPLQPLQALRVVAPARHRHRAHPAGPPPAERAPRAHAPDPQARDHPPGRRQHPAAAGPLRRFRP